MGSPLQSAAIWRFGAFQVDDRTGELRRNGLTIRLQEQPARLLLFLLQHAGELVTREQLRQHLWPSDTFVDFDHALNTAVMKLREALGDSTERAVYIQTIPRKGYRFVAPVFDPQTAAPETTNASNGSDPVQVSSGDTSGEAEIGERSIVPTADGKPNQNRSIFRAGTAGLCCVV